MSTGANGFVTRRSMTGEMACARCGRRVPVRFGVMPRRCSCGAEFEWAPFGGAGRVAAFLAALALLMSGAEFEWAPFGGAGRVAAFLAALALLMSPLLILVWIARSLLQDSIVLLVVALAAALYWLRVCETAFLAALALLMSPLLILVWIARSLLQDSIVLLVVALAAALYWLRVCETLLVRFGLLRMEGVDAS